MGNDVTEHVELPYYCTIKVHRLMCLELKKFIDRISHIFSAVETARPRCTSGMQALCSLHVAMDKAKLLIQHCSECSKLYLAITADKILLRCEKIRNNLELCLSQIQNVVPTLLAAKISGIIDDLRNTKFHLESSEDEAGKVVLALLRWDMSASGPELEALQLVALRLNITSPLALLIEKRSIKRLYDKVCDADSTKKKILKHLLFLLRKYGELILQHQAESILASHEESYYHCVNGQDVTQADESGTPEPPLEFKCPISMRLMYDPVVIASGKTFERVWIEKWFNEGHQTCPITHMRLDHMSLTPNSAMKGLISKWCLRHGITISEPNTRPIPALLSSQKSSCSSSIASFAKSLDDLRLQTSNVSLHSSDTDCRLDSPDGRNNDDSSLGLPQINANSHGYCSSTNSHGIALDSLSKLSSLSWSFKCIAVEYVKEQLKDDDHACSTISSSGMMPLIKFLEDAHDLGDIRAQRDGAEVLLAVLSSSRIGMPLHEDAIYMLAAFLDSEITDKALEIMEVLSCQLHYKSGVVASGILPSILKLLDTQIREFHKLAIKILCNLSGNSDIRCHLVYLDFIPKLVPFLEDPTLAGYCIKIIKDLCNDEEARTAVSETNLCITSIARLLETGTKEEQENAVQVLLILCYEHAEYCQRLVTTESIIPSLFDISLNGNSKAMVIAMELLQLLGHITAESDSSACSIPDVGSISDISSNSGNNSKDNKSYSEPISDISSNSGNKSKDNKSSSKGFRFLGKKISRFLHATH